jgi:hypothetical protein
MAKLIVLACLALAIAAAVGVTTYVGDTGTAYLQFKAADGVVWKHEWRW